MTLVALLLLGQFPLSEAARPPQRERVERMGGRSGPSLAFFEFAPASGAGVGAECACAAVTGAKGEVVTTSRASVAWCTKADYSLVSCGNNLPRVMTGGGSTLPLGLLGETQADTNQILHNRDLSQATWTKTTMTCAKTATGADGVANSASTCTATAGNATVTQAVALAGQYAHSIYLKRRTGTGAVSVTVDNGVTWTDITNSLSSSVFKRAVPSETVGCMYGGCIVVRAMAQNFGVSSTLGIRLATNGDAVDVDLAQVEGGAAGHGYWASSPITTGAAAATRAVEVHTATVPSFSPQSISAWHVITGTGTGFLYNMDSTAQAAGGNQEFALNTSTSYSPIEGTPGCFLYSNPTLLTPNSTEISPGMGPSSSACSNDGTTVTSYFAGYAVTSASTITPSSNVVTTLTVGGRGAGATGAGVISHLCADPSPTRCTTTTQPATNAVVWVGDSISAGSVSSPATPPSELAQLIGRTTYNKGLPSDNVAGCHSRFTGRVAGKGYSTLVYACGTNDCIAGTTAVGHATWTTSLSTITAARSAGMGVVVANIMPEKKAATWTTSIQDCVDAYNSDWATWCAANVSSTVKCVDSYAQFGGGTGGVCGAGDPACMLNAYDSGDGRHPNQAGGIFFAAIVADAGVP